MEINFRHKTERMYQEYSIPSKRIQVTVESVVPDVNEDIGRIVTVKPTVLLKSKELNGHGVSVSGELTAVLLYITEGEDRVSCVKMMKEFSLEYEAEGIAAENLAQIRLNLGNAEARVLNPRKVSVTVEVIGELSSYRLEELVVETLLPEEAQDALYVKKEEAEATVVNAVCEKSFALNEQYRFPDGKPQPCELVSEDVRLCVENVEQVGSRVVVKGKIWVGVCYLSEDVNYPLWTEFSSAFSQIVDTGAEECISSTACVELTNTYFDLVDTISGDKALDMELHAVLQLVSRARQTITFLADAYSNRMPAACAYQTITLTEMSDMRRITLETEQELNLGDDCEDVLQVFASVAPTGVLNARMNGQVNLDVIYRGTGGSLAAARRSLPLESEVLPPATRVQETRLLHAEVRREGNRLLGFASVEAVIQSVESRDVAVVAAVNLSEEGESVYQKLPSVSLVRTSGEDLWELAKNYHSSVEGIRAVNDMESPLPGRLLLIPRES